MKRINLVQGSEEWLLFREDHVGASDSAAIMHKNPWKSDLAVWEEKKLGKKMFKSAAMERGNELEGMIRDWYSEHYTKVEPAVFVDDEHEWFSVSYDGISEDLKTIIEIKVVGEKSYQRFLNEEIPEYYMIQCNKQMYLARVNSMTLLVSDGSPPEISPPLKFRIEADKELQREIFESDKFFYENYMVTFTPPEPTESTIVERTDSEWCEAAEACLKAKEELEEAEEKLKICKESLRYLAGEESARGAGVSLVRSLCRGTVDYKKIPELKGVNLECYRKPVYEKWTLKVNKLQAPD